MKTGRNIITGIISLLLILLFINNCGGGEKKQGSDYSNIPEPDKSTYEVEFTDNTVVIDEDVMDSFISSDKKSGVYKFKSDADDLLDLKPGKIVFFYGNSVRRVKNVVEDENEIVVNTEYISFKRSD